MNEIHKPENYTNSEKCIAEGLAHLFHEAHTNARNKGWWDEHPEAVTIRRLYNDGLISLGTRDSLLKALDRNLGEQLMLQVSELAEALEWARKDENAKSDHIPDFTGIEEEFADVIIRIADTASARKLNVIGAVIHKMRFNTTRPYKHGKKL